MKYKLVNVITANAGYKQNENGSITTSNVIIHIGIEGSPEGKFIQAEMMTDIILPASGTNEENLNFIKAQAAAYVAAQYPNT